MGDGEPLSERVLHGNCLDLLATLDADSIDSCVTDPPYGLGFMGKAWDSDFLPGDSPMRRTAQRDAVNTGAARQGGRQRACGDYGKRMARDSREFQAWVTSWAVEVLRVLKPGAHLLAFGGTRTYHRLACAIEDAGFEIRDTLAWMYGQGFPKSLDVSKAIDKAAGAEREVVGSKPVTKVTGGRALDFGADGEFGRQRSGEIDITAPATDAARQWQGWGTALKPAFEPIVLARKPLVGTVAANVMQHGTGALNVDGCRIGVGEGGTRDGEPSDERRYSDRGAVHFTATPGPRGGDARGRWPANVLLGHHEKCVEPGGCRTETWLNVHGNSEGRMIREPKGWCHPDCAVRMLDEQSGESVTPTHVSRGRSHTGNAYSIGTMDKGEPTRGIPSFGDSGGASRFFYTAKASRREREGSKHPTVKPLDLMRWLVRLVTPPGGTVLDPFAGTGTTGEAALMEGFSCVLIEREAEYVADIEKRLRETQLGMVLS